MMWGVGGHCNDAIDDSIFPLIEPYNIFMLNKYMLQLALQKKKNNEINVMTIIIIVRTKVICLNMILSLKVINLLY